jgi:hypothetical protein
VTGAKLRVRRHHPAGSPLPGTTSAGTRLPPGDGKGRELPSEQQTSVGVQTRGRTMPDIQAMTKQLNDQLQRENECLKLWNTFEPVTVTDQRRKTFNVRSEMITRCKLNIQKYRETIAALEEKTSK